MTSDLESDDRGEATSGADRASDEAAAKSAGPVASGPDAAAPRRLCPYLVGRGGDWRAAGATRDHRCAAVDPPAALTPEKQRRLCLGTGHRECSTYLAARRALVPGAGETTPVGGRPDGGAAHRWPVPRTAPVVIERGRPNLFGHPRTRLLGQVLLVALMAVAFILLLVARSG